MDITTESVQIPTGETFHVLQSGARDKPAILWLHGSGPGATARSNWERVLGMTGDRYWNIAPDIIGFGHSTHPEQPPQGLAAFTRYRVQTLLALLDVLGVEKVNLVGNSMGGIISLNLVLTAPGRVDRLMAMGTAGAPVKPTADIMKLVRFYDSPTTEAMAELMTCFVHDPSMFGTELYAIAAQRMPMATRAEVERSHRATFGPPDPAAPPIAPLVTEANLAALNHRMLFMHGREDRMVSPENSYWLSQRIRNAHLHIFPNTGHWLMIEHPKEFVGLIDAFMADAI